MTIGVVSKKRHERDEAAGGAVERELILVERDALNVARHELNKILAIGLQVYRMGRSL